MMELLFSIIIAVSLVSIYFISDTLVSYWKYLLPKRKYTYLSILIFLIIFLVIIVKELKKII
jgi:hypothetical protein